MEKGLKAFYYDYKYYLLPEGMDDVEQLKKETAVEVKRLKEELCMAPNFIYESMETELLAIEAPERIFPVTVDLYTSKEYNAILLQQVKSRCQGCSNYTDDGTDDLNGHHREMALDGVCYIRETEDEPYSFTLCAWIFWSRLADKAKELEKYVEKNDQKSLNKLVGEELKRFFLPYEVYGGVTEEGKYFLAFSANDYPQYGLRLILKMLADMANHENSPMKEAGWVVYPYFPKNIFVPSKRKPNYMKKPPLYFVTEEEDGGLGILVYDEKLKKAKEKALAEASGASYDLLCHRFGEDTLLAACATLGFRWEEQPEGREVTLDELGTVMEAHIPHEEGQTEVLFPFPVLMGSFAEANEEEPRMLPFKQDMQFCASVCPEMSPIEDNSEKDLPNTMFEDFGVVYAYLYLPNGADEEDSERRRAAFAWYMSNLEQYPEPIRDAKDWQISAESTGYTVTKEGFCFDQAVFDEKKYFRWLRNLTPVLQALGVKIVLAKNSGTVVYEPGYAIRAEGGDWLS